MSIGIENSEQNGRKELCMNVLKTIFTVICELAKHVNFCAVQWKDQDRNSY